jgi:glutamyl-Q tRNA(Asp) synthetase
MSGAGRFAPSPTGPLHPGTLVAALGSFLLARRAGLRWLLRIDDLDKPRVVPGAAEDILRILELAGLHWDGAPLRQSRRTARYAEVLQQLKQARRVYPCSCSRKEVLASAPHAGEDGPVYAGLCRERPAGSLPFAWRLRVDRQVIQFRDQIFGTQVQSLADEVGDFVLMRADGVFAYQLATVVDDLDTGVTQVVRGADLLGSTARQIYLYQCLGARAPEYLHLPLLLSADGQKFSKRHCRQALVQKENLAPMLLSALKVLGQNPPAELACCAPALLIDWALEHFDLTKIPVASQFMPP